MAGRTFSSSKTNSQFDTAVADPGAAKELRAAIYGIGTGASATQNDPASVTITTIGGAANVSLNTMTFKDTQGNVLTYGYAFTWWLSDATTGIGLTATTASGAVAAGASGTDLVALVSKKMTISQCTVAGVYIASITDTAKTAFILTVQLENGSIWTGPTLIYT